jgi:hypothetical protein
MSIPDSSIEGIKPIFKPIPVETRKMKFGTQVQVWKRCCICGAIPTKMATYPIQGAVVIERYCESCVEKEFSKVN